MGGRACDNTYNEYNVLIRRLDSNRFIHESNRNFNVQTDGKNASVFTLRKREDDKYLLYTEDGNVITVNSDNTGLTTEEYNIKQQFEINGDVNNGYTIKSSTLNKYINIPNTGSIALVDSPPANNRIFASLKDGNSKDTSIADPIAYIYSEYLGGRKSDNNYNEYNILIRDQRLFF